MCFFFNDTATTEIYTLSLHDALPIWAAHRAGRRSPRGPRPRAPGRRSARRPPAASPRWTPRLPPELGVEGLPQRLAEEGEAERDHDDAQRGVDGQFRPDRQEGLRGGQDRKSTRLNS